MGGLEPWAASTSPTMWASTVSEPAAVTSNSKAPVPLTVPPVTSSPADFSWKRGSPVSMDSSTEEWPETTRPSAGTRSPGRTAQTSPTASSPWGTSTRESPRRTHATAGVRLMSSSTAAPARPLARCSSILPSMTNVMSMALVSNGAMTPDVARGPNVRYVA